MADRLLFPLGVLIDLAPFIFLCYQPFINHIKITKGKLCLLLTVLLGIQFQINYFYYWMPYQMVKFSFFAFLVLYFFVYSLTIQAEFSKLLFVFLLIANYAGVVVCVSNSIEMYFFPAASRINGYSVPLLVITILVLAVSLPLIEMIYHFKIKPHLYEIQIKVWNILWIIPFTFLLTIIVIEGADQDDLIASWQYSITTITMAVGSTAVYYTVFKMLSKTYDNIMLKEKIRFIDLQLALQEKSYKCLNERITEAKKARHDLRHHLSVIEAYLQSDDKEALEQYLVEYKTSLPDDSKLMLCENYAANAVLQHVISIAKSEGIPISAHLHLPQNIGIADSDLCIVFGNCLENALEACRRMPSGNRYIFVKSSLQGHSLGITIDNSCDGNIHEQDGIFYSSKRFNEEGIGISSVKSIAAKYNGIALFSYDDKEFHSSIVLNFQ